MISKATCQAGLIKGVFTKPMTYTNVGPHNDPQSRHRFRRCGFASLLSYFCFLDGNHLPNPTGYQIEADQSALNPWMNGNMPTLRQAPANFNNQRCKIIYVINQHPRSSLTPTDRRPQRGSRAILYGAFAAEFDEMVAYKNPPCHQNNPDCPCSDDNEMGHTFRLRDIFQGFNRASNTFLQPGQAGHLGNTNQANFELIHFDRHFGNQWFFCKRRRGDHTY